MCEQAEQVQTLALRFEQNLWFTLNQDVRLTFEGKSLQFASKVADRDEKTLLEVRTSQFDGLLPALKHRLSGQFTDTYWIAAKDMSRLPADTNLSRADIMPRSCASWGSWGLCCSSGCSAGNLTLRHTKSLVTSEFRSPCASATSSAKPP